MLWLSLKTGHNFFRFVFGKTFHYTDEGWDKFTRNVAFFFLATAVVNEIVRLGFAHAHIIALNRVFTGVDIWILFKIFITMPVTALFFWWQARVLQKYRLPEPIAEIAPAKRCDFLGRASGREGTGVRESAGMNEEAKRPGIAAPPNPHIKLLIEFGPLAAFGITYFTAGIFWATGVVMVTSVVALAASWTQFGRLLPVPLMTAVLVVVFGGLTFWLNDPRFIKIKPTIINLLFAGVLFFGLMTGRPLLKLLLGEAFNLTEEGWRKLSFRWALFFLALAALNELVWRSFSETVWVNFKVFGILGLSLVFAMAQIGLIKRHEAKTGT